MLLLQMLLASEACRQAPIRKVEQIPDSVLVQRDIRFLPGDRAEKADIYRPAAQTPAAKKLPAVVIIQGAASIPATRETPVRSTSAPTSPSMATSP